MAAVAEHGHYHPEMWVFPNPRQVTADVSAKSRAMPKAFTIALIVSAVMLGLGIIGFIARAAQDGFGDYAPWGYYMFIFSFVFMVTSTAPLASAIFRVTKSHWRRPLSRVS